MKYVGLYIILLSIMVFGSCDTNQIECIRASTKTVTELRDLRDFRGVIFNQVGDLILTQGPEYSFLVNGPVNVLQSLTTTIEDEILIIGTENCFNGSYNLRVEISAPEFELINLVGIGNIETVGSIDGNIIQVELVGIGDIIAEFNADTVYTNVAGNGTISYSGEVIKHAFQNAGEVTLNAFPLMTQETTIDISGIGDCQVTASDLLDVTITGTGNVFYQGAPQIIPDISGVGEIIDSN